MTGLLAYLRSAEYKKLQVWMKGRVILGYDPSIWRYDDNGNPIRFSDYGNRSSQYGWEMDHYPIPDALGGLDDVSNLRPLRCRDNASYGGRLAAALMRR
jgi:hypothetical protein